MGKIIQFLACFVLVALGASPSFAATNADEYKAAFRFNHGQGFQNSQLGSKVVREQMRDLRLQYSFANNGGAVSTIKLWQPNDAGGPGTHVPYLPKNAIIVGCYVDVITALTSGGSATVAISTGQTAADIMAATAYGSFTGIMACIPTGSAASSIKLTADQQPSITIAVAALTAGVFNVHLLYVLSDQ